MSPRPLSRSARRRSGDCPARYGLEPPCEVRPPRMAEMQVLQEQEPVRARRYPMGTNADSHINSACLPVTGGRHGCGPHSLIEPKIRSQKMPMPGLYFRGDDAGESPHERALWDLA